MLEIKKNLKMPSLKTSIIGSGGKPRPIDPNDFPISPDSEEIIKSPDKKNGIKDKDAK
jgi:hypothetical protein